MATAAAAAVAKARRDIQHHFFSEDAVRPERAVGFEPRNGMQGRQFDRMRSKNIIREAKPGVYWLDVVAYDVDLRERHARVRIVLLALVILLFIGFATSLITR
ncbi:MAG: hypothetical protein ACJ8FT_00495 [Sphingomonas sp.]